MEGLPVTKSSGAGSREQGARSREQWAKKPKKSKAATTKAFRNLFIDLPFRGRLKEAPSGLEAAKYEPRIDRQNECGHVKIDRWWLEEDDRSSEDGSQESEARSQKPEARTQESQ